MAETQRFVAVGLGEIQCSRDPGDVLVAYGLGSCVGVTAYDPVVRGGGMAHVMLPGDVDREDASRSAKFASQALPLLLEALANLGCDRSRLVWKIAGGARVLRVPGAVDQMTIGDRNVAVVKRMMEQLGLPLAAEDTGGRQGRTMQLNIDTGEVAVRTIGGVLREL
mgnify:CR=1 FL=1